VAQLANCTPRFKAHFKEKHAPSLPKERRPRAKSHLVLVYEMAGKDPIPIATPSFTAV